MECWNIKAWQSSAELWQMWPQLVCCALTLKNLMSINLGLVEDYGARWSKVEQSGGSQRCGEVQSKVERSREMWRSPKQCGGVWSNIEKSGATWRSLEQHGEVWSNMEKGYMFYFDYKLESCPEAIELLYKTSEMLEQSRSEIWYIDRKSVV